MFCIGLDLGQRQDFTAIAVVERGEAALLLRHLERMALGTPYTRVVRRVSEMMAHAKLAGQSELVVDATGVGAPVVEMLRSAGVGSRMTAVTITGGEGSHGRGGEWHVPRRDLLAGLEVLIETGELKIAKRLGEAGQLVRELTGLRAMRGERGRWRAEEEGEHDDLAIAAALACWRARRARNAMGRNRLPGI